MKKRRAVFLLCMLLAAAVSGSVHPLPVMAAKSAVVTDSEQKISDNKKKIKKLEEESAGLKEEISRLEGLKNDAAAYIADLDRRKEQMEEDLRKKEAEAEEIGERILVLEEELKKAEEEVENRKAGMAIRMKYMYESGHSGYLDRLLRSENFASALNSIEYVEKVTEFDREKLEEFKEAVREKNRKLEELESERAVLAAGTEAMQTELDSLKELSEKKEAELRSFEERISAADDKTREIGKDVGRLKAAIKEEENRIARIEAEEKRREEEARKKAEQENREYTQKTIGDLRLQWPVPSSGRITSSFGSREAPVDGASTSHKGIDIGAQEGSDILAAEKGTVVISTYSESAGNYVMISHGGGIYTVYMHMNKRLVSVDEEVSAGQKIGYVGSTGYSTGPHLHFGIRINGEYVDPQIYVRK